MRMISLVMAEFLLQRSSSFQRYLLSSEQIAEEYTLLAIVTIRVGHRCRFVVFTHLVIGAKSAKSPN